MLHLVGTGVLALAPEPERPFGSLEKRQMFRLVLMTKNNKTDKTLAGVEDVQVLGSLEQISTF